MQEVEEEEQSSTEEDMFFYSPELADLPDFEMLPDVLDLPNVAQDLTFSAAAGSLAAGGAIAPSSNTKHRKKSRPSAAPVQDQTTLASVGDKDSMAITTKLGSCHLPNFWFV